MCTMLCWLLPYGNTNQPLYIHPLPSPLSPIPHPVPTAHHRAPDWTPVLHSNFSPAICPTPDSVYMLMLLSLFVPLTPSPTVFHMSILYI